MSFSRRGLVCLLGLAALLPLLVRSSPETARADAPSKKKLLPVMSQGTGTLKGRVTLEGDPPDLKALDKQIKAQMELVKQHAECCLKGTADETGQQVWRLGKDKGVGNVFVWLAPPDGHYFEIDWKKKTWPKEIVIDQPHCAFIPHAVVHFPGAYEDGDPDKELKSSGQVLTVKNSAPIDHNVHWSGGELNPGNNYLVPKGAKPLEIKNLVPSSEPFRLACDIHKWMTAVVRVFDHPYAALTDKDGNFEIKNAPAGAEVRVLIWHEAENRYAGKEVDKVTLDDGKTTEGKRYTIKAQK